MLHLFFDEGYWFAPKKYGYGAGWPIKWQGWVFLMFHILLIFGIIILLNDYTLYKILAILVAAFAPFPIYKARTKGGWKWRSGKKG